MYLVIQIKKLRYKIFYFLEIKKKKEGYIFKTIVFVDNHDNKIIFEKYLASHLLKILKS